MPIQDADPDTIASQVLQPHAGSNGKAHYVVFFASGNPPWCPDCVRAQPALEKVFGSASGMPILHKILVGERHEWKTSENRWRKAPFQVDQTPTVIKFIDVRR